MVKDLQRQYGAATSTLIVGNSHEYDNDTLKVLQYSNSTSTFGNSTSLSSDNIQLEPHDESYLQALADKGGRVVVISNEVEENWRCCLNNVIMKTMTVFDVGCKAAREYDVFQLPSNLDVGGQFVSEDFQLFTPKDIASLVKLGKKKGCNIVSKDAAKRIFTLPRKMIKRSGGFNDNGDYLHWFYSSFQFPARIKKTARECIPGIEEGNFIAAHLRVEKDWCNYCKGRDRKAKSSHGACRTPRQIAEQTADEVPRNTTETIVLIHGKEVCPEYNIGTNEHPSEVWPQIFPNARIVTKLDGSLECKRQLEKLRYNELAFVDLYYAVGGSKFVGTQMSTFSNGSTQIRVIRGNYENYLYSCPLLAPLIKRFDDGDAGGRCQSAGGGDAGTCKWNYEQSKNHSSHQNVHGFTLKL